MARGAWGRSGGIPRAKRATFSNRLWMLAARRTAWARRRGAAAGRWRRRDSLRNPARRGGRTAAARIHGVAAVAAIGWGEIPVRDSPAHRDPLTPSDATVLSPVEKREALQETFSQADPNGSTLSVRPGLCSGVRPSDPRGGAVRRWGRGGARPAWRTRGCHSLIPPSGLSAAWVLLGSLSLSGGRTGSSWCGRPARDGVRSSCGRARPEPGAERLERPPWQPIYLGASPLGSPARSGGARGDPLFVSSLGRRPCGLRKSRGRKAFRSSLPHSVLGSNPIGPPWRPVRIPGLMLMLFPLDPGGSTCKPMKAPRNTRRKSDPS